MKNFLRSTAGKAVTFILCILALLLAAVCAVSGIVMAKMEFYINTEEQLQAELHEALIQDRAEQIILNTVEYTIPDHKNDKTAHLRFVYDQSVPDDGNLVYTITDTNGKAIAVSEHAQDIESWEFSRTFAYSENPDGMDAFIRVDYPGYEQSENDIILNAGLKSGLPESDHFRFFSNLFHFAYSMRYAVFVLCALSLILGVICFIILMCVSGRRPGSGDIHPGPLHKVPYDLLLAIAIAFVAVSAFAAHDLFPRETFFGLDVSLLFLVPLLLVYAAILLGLCMSAAARIKQKTLLKNTVIFYFLKGLGLLCRAIWRGFSKIPLIWKTALLVAGITGVDWILMLLSNGMRSYFFLSLLEKIVIIPIVLYIAYCMRRLKKCGERLAAGDLDHHMDTRGLFWDLKKHGEDLNRISEGMAAAVNDRMKSERMKTELITNVSHDIKTPLTSIINYAGLISTEAQGSEPADQEKIREYAGVLVRQSERLKRLLEDLVEASKASTGNLDVDLTPCDANLFVDQAAGEYEAKLSAAQLELVAEHPEQELMILVDGRRMWRIFDNLMNNICKYALAGSRVYLTLEKEREQAVFTFRNVSKEALNISEEELMERFTRGDSSRNTEGNGLGLSIAKSLVQLQNGEMKIVIDGDLFKVRIVFPLYRSKPVNG